MRWASKCLAVLLCIALLAPTGSGAQTTDEKKTNGDWIWITLGVGGIIYLLTHHPSRAHENTPSPAPSATPVALKPPEETPLPSPSPTSEQIIYHEEPGVPCTVSLDGYMQPTQGIWQDDRIFPKPRMLTRYEGDHPIYDGPWDLIADRPTLIAGVYQYRKYPGNQIETPDDRGGTAGAGHIKIEMSNNCPQKNAERYRLEFSFYINGKKTWENIHDEGYKAPFEGYKQTPGSVWLLSLPAPVGYPETGGGFTPAQTGHYALMLHIQRFHNGYWEDVPNLVMSVHGTIVRTHGFEIHYVPVHLSAAARVALNQDEVGKSATRIAKSVGLTLPDLYPLPPSNGNDQAIFPWKVESDKDGDVTDLSSDNHLLHPEIDLPKDLRDVLGPNPGLTPGLLNYQNAIMDALTNAFGMAAVLEKTGRMVVVVDDHDAGLLGMSGAAAYTTEKKLIVSRAGEEYTTIGHELAHTLPWDLSQKLGTPDSDRVPWMLSECERGYHNVTSQSEGLRFIWDGKVTGTRKHYNFDTGLMGPAGADRYDEQCTYRHLTAQIKGKIPDPRVFLVRGYVGRNATRMAAAFTPFYTVQSTVDADAIDPSQDLRIDLRSAAGALLKEVSFKALFMRPDDSASVLKQPRIIAFFERVPYIAGTREIDLVSRSRGLLARKAISVRAPIVQLSASASTVREGRNVTLHWAVSSAIHGSLYASVFDSTNGGESYVTKSIEQRADTFTLRMFGIGKHLLRVVVSDGSQSGEATVSVTVTP